MPVEAVPGHNSLIFSHVLRLHSNTASLGSPNFQDKVHPWRIGSTWRFCQSASWRFATTMKRATFNHNAVLEMNLPHLLSIQFLLGCLAGATSLFFNLTATDLDYMYTESFTVRLRNTIQAQIFRSILKSYIDLIYVHIKDKVQESGLSLLRHLRYCPNSFRKRKAQRNAILKYECNSTLQFPSPEWCQHPLRKRSYSDKSALSSTAWPTGSGPPVSPEKTWNVLP